MKDQSKDETRWLLRLFAVLFVLFGVQGGCVQFNRISSGEDFSVFSLLFAMGVVLLLFWLGWRLWRCASFWNILSWMPQTPPLFLYMQCQYFRLGQHVRCGLVAGLIFLIMEVLLFPYMCLQSKGTWLYDFVGDIWAIIHWPVAAVFRLNTAKEDRAVLIAVSVFTYIFVIGFIFGWCMSRIKQMLANRKNKIDEPMAILYNQPEQ